MTDLKKYSPTDSFEFTYAYRKVSVNRLQELQQDIEILKSDGRLSENATYRSYIDDMKFALPGDFPDARSIVVVAVYNKPLFMNLHLNSIKHEIVIPPQYYITGLKEEHLTKLIAEEIIKEPGHRIEKTHSVHLKLLAVMSGLGKYGRNNLCYVEGMGTMLALHAFYTGFEFEEYHWTEKQMMNRCINCNICINKCPTNAITKDNFVVDVGKCVTLYNEIEGEFPKWIESDVHNALYGCMKCQENCPANLEVINIVDQLEDMPDEIAQRLINANLEQNSHSIYDTLLLSDESRMKITARNLKVLVERKPE